MSMTLGDAVFYFRGDLQDLERGSEQARKIVDQATKDMSASYDKFSGGLSQGVDQINALGDSMMRMSTVVVGAFAGIGTAIYGGMAACIKQAMDADSTLKMVENTLKSTDGAAGMTSESLQGLAGEIQKLTPLEDDAVLAGEGMLLTFTNIGKDAFPRATKAMVDMATFMANGAVPNAEALRQQAIQLGKALNDPVQGISALSRVGVSFTEETKETIKTLVAENKVFEAQDIILKELEKEFGGTAAALKNSASGEMAIFWRDIGNFMEYIGGIALPLARQMFEILNKNIAEMQQWLEANKMQVAVIIDGFMKPLLNMLSVQLPLAMKWLQDNMFNIAGFIQGLFSGFTSEAWGAIQSALGFIGGLGDLRIDASLGERIGTLAAKFIEMSIATKLTGEGLSLVRDGLSVFASASLTLQGVFGMTKALTGLGFAATAMGGSWVLAFAAIGVEVYYVYDALQDLMDATDAYNKMQEDMKYVTDESRKTLVDYGISIDDATWAMMTEAEQAQVTNDIIRRISADRRNGIDITSTAVISGYQAMADAAVMEATATESAWTTAWNNIKWAFDLFISAVSAAVTGPLSLAMFAIDKILGWMFGEPESRASGGITQNAIIRAAEQGPEYAAFPGGGGGVLPKDGLYAVPVGTHISTAAETAAMFAGAFASGGKVKPGDNTQRLWDVITPTGDERRIIGPRWADEEATGLLGTMDRMVRAAFRAGQIDRPAGLEALRSIDWGWDRNWITTSYASRDGSQLYGYGSKDREWRDQGNVTIRRIPEIHGGEIIRSIPNRRFQVSMVNVPGFAAGGTVGGGGINVTAPITINATVRNDADIQRIAKAVQSGITDAARQSARRIGRSAIT